MHISRFTFLILFFFLPIFLLAQRAPKFGKTSKEEQAIEKTDLDPNANAIILSDYGEIDFQGGTVTIAKHRKIKILNQKGLEEANVGISFYAKDGIEKVFKIKAHTINFDEKGKAKKTKLKKKEFFTVDINENWKQIRFTFPDVKPGSIVEYEYVKTSESAVSLESWEFQNELPTLRSHLAVIIGAGLDYKIVYNGNRLIQKYGGENRNSWMLESLPPLREEPFCPNPEDYVESIRFQLAGYKKYSDIPGEGLEYVELMSTWENLAKEMLDFKDYAGILKKKKAADKLVQQIVDEDDSQRDKIKKIYAYVQKSIDWDNNYRLFPDEKFSKIMESRRGNSAEINLCLVRLLQSAGFDANPLIISTKRNGLITKVYPLYNQFNHVLANVELYGKDITMDAVSKYRPYNLLSKNDLNPLGFLLHETESRWVEIPFPKKNKTVIVTNLEIEEEKMNYEISYSFFQHDAVSKRIAYASESEEEDFINNHIMKNLEEDEMELDSFKIKYADNIAKPLSVVCYVSKEIEDGLSAEYIYIDPFLNHHVEKNPFNDPIRYLPVDFVLPTKEKFILNLTLPKGYELAEPIEGKKFSMDSEEKIKYSFLYKDPIPERIQLSSELLISEPMVFPKEYGALRELFSMMVGLQSTQIVLKKKG